MDEISTDEASQIHRARTEIGRQFLRGRGIEVGAGTRPFPVPKGAEVAYGDIRQKADLRKYFHGAQSPVASQIDAQTFSGLAERSFDFVISAHVVEHLRDPIGAIVNALRILKPGGIHLLVVPEMRRTFDQRRPETTVDHLLADFRDGGKGTTRQAYEEHLRYVHPFLTGEEYPETEIQRQASENAKRWRDFDVHFHAWSRPGFEALLAEVRNISPFIVETVVSAINENIFVLRKRQSLWQKAIAALRRKQLSLLVHL